MTLTVTDTSFPTDVKNFKGFVLIDFWAEWCGPCRQLGPIVDEVAETMHGKVKVMKMNIDENPEIPSQLGIRSIPTLMLFKDGQQVATRVGSLPKTNLIEWLESQIAA
jgi:thioredoxin 1